MRNCSASPPSGRAVWRLSQCRQAISSCQAPSGKLCAPDAPLANPCFPPGILRLCRARRRCFKSACSRFLVSAGAAAVLLAVTPRSWGCDSCLAFSRPLSSLARAQEGAPARLNRRHRCAATALVAPLRCRRRTAAGLQAAASVAARHHVGAARGVVGAVALHAVAAAAVQVAQRARISTRCLQIGRLGEIVG